MGKRREQGQSLYETFEGLLEELGFAIELAPDEEEIQEITKNLDKTFEAGVAANAHLQATSAPRNRSRRASFNSMYDAGDETTRACRSREPSRASMSRLESSQQATPDNRPSTRATTRRTEKTNSNAWSPRRPAVQARRDRLTADEFAHIPQRSQGRQVSASVRGGHGKHHLAALYSSTAGASSTASDFGDDASQAPVTPHIDQTPYGIGLHERFYRPSITQLLRDADTFQHYRIRSYARDIVEKWCLAAFQAKDQHAHMDRLASAHDTQILLRQAFEHWRVRLHTKKQAAETERYFNRMERNTAKARDIHLLTKAFTHWAQCAQETVLQTHNAREYILGMKYFRAWREITLVNQLKMRRQGLRKYFGIWKQRYVGILRNYTRADLVGREILSKSTYWHWFWAFCERRAPEWRAGRLKRKTLSQWIDVFRDNVRRYQQTTTQSDNTARKKILTQWLEMTQGVIACQRQAASFNYQRQTIHAIRAWKSSRQYAPLAQRVSNMVDWRVAGVTFATLISRYRFKKQAEHVNTLRIMKNAWTHWNDCLRWQILAHRIDDRYLLEALYKWVVAERQILLQRLSEQRLKQRLFTRLKTKCTLRQAERESTREFVEAAGQKGLLRLCMTHWSKQLSSYRRAEQVAFEFYAPKIAQDTLQAWTRKSAHLQTLNGWAKDADFYFVTRRFLKRWQAATGDSKRQKRRRAYVQVRRRSKMNLARKALHRWRGVSTRVRDMELEAGLTNQNRLLCFGTYLYDQWNCQFNLRREQTYNASQYYERRLLERYLYTWIEKVEDLTKLEEMADLNTEMRAKSIAFGWLHKLHLRIIELKGQEANAENLRGWYEKRHFSNILRHWRKKTSKRLDQPLPAKTFSSRPSRRRPQATEAEDRDELARRAEDWTDFDIGDWIPALEAQSSTTPLPGYLSTPSKRAARAQALVRVSTTPSSTPFENRLRSQIGSTPRTPRRSGFGRSTTALKGSTFGVILEDSPRTPGREREG